MSTAVPRAAAEAAGSSAGGVVWPEAVRRAVIGLAQRHRPPAGSLRVLVGIGGAEVAGPYLEARARVVGTVEGDEDPRYHVRLPSDPNGLPWPHRSDDADLVVVVLPCLEPSCDVSRMLGGVARALAAGGLAVLGLPSHAGREPAIRWVGGGVARARLELRHHERLRVADGWFELMVVADPRPPPRGPAALATLDRTACVDRPRVLRAIEQAPWAGPDAASPAGSTAALRAALVRQLAAGEPDVRTLPWPRPKPPAGRDESLARDVLAIMPHPDDESIYAGGTLAGLCAAGARVSLVVATDGAGGRGGAGLAARRARELLAAAHVLGLRGLRCLGWADFGKYRDAARTTPVTAGDALRTWGLDLALAGLVAEIRRGRPHVLLGLDPETDPNLSLHGHHLGLGLLVALSFHAAADPSYAPELGSAWACDEHRVMVPAVHARWGDAFDVDREVKRRALRAHATQAYSTAPLLEALDDPRRPAVEITRRLQAHRAVPWWLVRRVEPLELAGSPPTAAAIDAGIDWIAEAARVRAVPRPRAALVELLRRQAETAPSDPAAERSLRMLARDDAVAVVTGQQVGLLGGPAYTLAKALSAVALARRLQQRGVAAVPVFWMASQDHDLREAQRVPRLDGTTLRLGLADTGAPVGPRALGPGIRALCERWAAELPGAHPELLALVERTHRPEHGFAMAFAMLLREVMRGTGLLLLDPMDPAFARLARPLLRRALVEAPAVDRALAGGRERLRARGLTEVVPTTGERTLVFAQGEHGARRRVVRAGAAELDALDRFPERLSPSALLRPVTQDAVLPTIAYVGGPTELRYLEQTDELYAWAGVPRPRALPRVSLQLARTRDVAALCELGRLEAEARPLEHIGRAALSISARTVLDEVEAALAHIDRSRPRASIDVVDLRARLARIERRMPAALPTLPRTARCWPRIQPALEERAAAVLDEGPVAPARALTRLRHGLHGLRRSLLRDGRRARPDAVAAWHRTSTRPAPAERRMTVAELLARTSPALPQVVVTALEAELPPALAIRIGGRP